MSEKNYLPENLRYLREANNISQPQLGQIVGCTRDNIASYERGTEPKLSTLNKIVNYFHVSIDDIVNLNLKEESRKEEVTNTPPSYDNLIIYQSERIEKLSAENALLKKENEELKELNKKRSGDTPISLPIPTKSEVDSKK